MELRLTETILHFPIYIIVFSSWLIIHTVASEAAIARPNCPTSCGNISIPFPFGIGSDCYVDEWFEIFCDNSTIIPKALLKRANNLEVLKIETNDLTVHGLSAGTSNKIQVRYPITFWNCTDKETREHPDFTGSPFVFSRGENMFTAVSCDVLALMSSNINQAKISTGCTSICSNSNNTINNTCNGVNCCQTNVPSLVTTFWTTFNMDTERDKECKYAFVVDQDWFTKNSAYFVAIREMDYVPVTLDWSLLPSEYEIIRQMNSSDRSNNNHCSQRNSTSFPNPTIILCSCDDGFEGNPYVYGGCQDINECIERHHPCGMGIPCVNTIGSFKCQEPKPNMLMIGFASGLGALFLLIGLWSLYRVIKKRKAIKRRQQFFKRNGGLLLQQQISSGEVNFDSKTKIFNSKELQKATDNFNVDRILGQGGQGTVFKGMLTDGKIVAVKKSKIIDEEKLTEFINEVIILSQINHRNVVKLLGFCLETEVPLLVYEFVPNGTLSEYLHDQNEEFLFTWEMRLRIALEIAGALSYLHSAASFPIYHRDIKSSNILLDEKLRAKVADFGTSKSVAIDQTHVTTMVHGTFGYLDPEYFQSSQFTDKSDVYSFGVVIVELLTGQKPICLKRLEEGRSLSTYFIMCMEENRLFDIVDPQIVKEGKNQEILEVANLAKRCLYLNGRYRPTMKEVATELEAIHKSIKTVSDQQSYEEVEYVRTEITEPWDVSTSIGSNPSTSSAVAPSLVELPLLSK